MSNGQPNWQWMFAGGPGDARTAVRMRQVSKRGEPFLLLPESSGLAAPALALYPAQSAKAKFLRKLLRWGAGLHLPLPFSRIELSLNPSAPLVQFLKHESGTAGLPAFAIYLGNPRTSGRRFILLLFSDSAIPVRVVKIGTDARAIELVEHEQKFLASLQGGVAGIPKLSSAHREPGLSAFSMEYLPGDTPIASDWPVIEPLLNAWANDAHRIRLDETVPWQQLSSVARGSKRQPRLQLLGQSSVATVIYHGDFAPWNLKVERRANRCTALDWERGEIAGVPGWDWLHYALQPAILVEKASVPELAKRMEQTLASAAFAAYANRCGIRGHEHALTLAYLLYCAEVLRPSEGLESIRALYQFLDLSWPND